MTDVPREPEPFVIRLGALRAKAARLKEQATDAAAKTGYIESATDQFATAWQAIDRASLDDSSLIAWIASGEAVAGELDRTLDDLSIPAGAFGNAVDFALPVFSTASSSGVVACNSISVTPSLHFQPCPFLPDSNEQAYAAKLEKLNYSLGGTYRGAWATRFDQRHDQGRSALWQIRQVFDHFFVLLAPEDAVRSSRHWTPKSPPKREAVHRRERLLFAAHEWIPSERRTTFVESVASTLQAYERLNQAHARGALSAEAAREAFHGVDAIVRRWVDSINPWPPTSGTAKL